MDMKQERDETRTVWLRKHGWKLKPYPRGTLSGYSAQGIAGKGFDAGWEEALKTAERKLKELREPPN